MKMKCIFLGHNTTPLVRFEPATLRSGTIPTELLVLPLMDEIIMLVRYYCINTSTKKTFGALYIISSSNFINMLASGQCQVIIIKHLLGVVRASTACEFSG